MAELETITLGELPEITSVGESDHILVESGGRMKRASSDLIGGGAYVLDLRSYEGEIVE